ncbi:MAG: type II toxin-antitoxin system VapC family toxin [Gammaproteobacteria bacterium]
MNFVLDTSVTMCWFFGDGKPQELIFASKVLDAMKDASALVPVTWGLEVANVIAKAEAKGLTTEFLETLQHVDIEVDMATFSHALSDTLQLARRYKLSAYASYLELALRKGIPLATLDKDLQKAAQKTGVKLQSA